MKTLLDTVIISGVKTRISVQYDTLNGHNTLINGCYLDGEQAGEWFNPSNWERQFQSKIREICTY